MITNGIPRLTTAALAGLLLAAGALAEDEGPPPHPLITIEKERYAAMVERDVNKLRVLLAPDLTYVHSTGILENKEEFLDLIASGDLQYVSIRPLDALVREYRGWGIVTGQLRVHVRVFGTSRRDTIRYTAVYRRLGGRWQLSAWQSTRAAN